MTKTPNDSLEEGTAGGGEAAPGAQRVAELPTTRYERVAPRALPTRDMSDEERERGPTGTPDLDDLDDLDDLEEDDDPLAHLAAMALEQVGSVIASRYELTRLLGTGAAGAVFAAQDSVEDRAVALKILHGGLRTSDEQVVRFRREARAATSIGHSSIVTVYDVGRDGDDGCFYMVMELLRGEALFYAIADRTLSDDDVREIGKQLFDALSAAHSRGIVHRDVKPENIILTKGPTGALRVKLLDFGIAKFIRTDMARSFATMDGLLIGTPHYMSPEVCTGAPIDEYTDLWAAAAVLFHAFAGRPPYDGEHIGRLLMKIVREKAPSLATLRPDLPENLIAAIDRGLDKDREKRFRTAREFSDALSVGGADVGGLDWDDFEG